MFRPARSIAWSSDKPTITVERRAFVQLFHDALHFFNDNIAVKLGETVLAPKQMIVLANEAVGIFLFHAGCSFVKWQPSIEYMEFISTSRKFISEILGALAALSAQDTDGVAKP